jgi:anti-sigma factor (TIGR02949 family)
MSRALSCAEALTLLQDYLKEELSEERVAEVRRHLEGCRDCAMHACFERHFLERLTAQAARLRCPDQVRARVLEALRGPGAGA